MLHASSESHASYFCEQLKTVSFLRSCVMTRSISSTYYKQIYVSRIARKKPDPTQADYDIGRTRDSVSSVHNAVCHEVGGMFRAHINTDSISMWDIHTKIYACKYEHTKQVGYKFDDQFDRWHEASEIEFGNVRLELRRCVPMATIQTNIISESKGAKAASKTEFVFVLVLSDFHHVRSNNRLQYHSDFQRHYAPAPGDWM